MLMMPALEPDEVDELTDLVTAAMSEPFHADGLELLLTTSIGIATSGSATDAFGLVREADAAIHAARAGGPGRHQVYDHKLRAQQVERLRTEAQLRRAIERDELVMHYQPILNVEDRSWSGVEALVRWQHPKRGLLSPDEFIPLAEETGLIVPLGMCVLEMVCRQARAWSRTLPGIRSRSTPRRCSSPIRPPPPRSRRRCERAQLDPPGTLTLEVTESALMEELDTARAVLEELQAAPACDVLIDDFGTGYSSLARLGELPISGLKIDRRFARGLGHDPSVMPVVRAIADLARAYGLEVVVEGIEDGEALAGVDVLRCEYAQGFHLGRPAPADDRRGAAGHAAGLELVGCSCGCSPRWAAATLQRCRRLHRLSSPTDTKTPDRDGHPPVSRGGARPGAAQADRRTRAARPRRHAALPDRDARAGGHQGAADRRQGHARDPPRALQRAGDQGPPAPIGAPPSSTATRGRPGSIST